MAERARLESVYTFMRIMGSNPIFSASFYASKSFRWICFNSKSSAKPRYSWALGRFGDWAHAYLGNRKITNFTLKSLFLLSVSPLKELTLIELWFGPLGKFIEGYFSVNSHWPEEIEDHRELYRHFRFLLYGCLDAGLDACIHSRAKFPQRDRVRARISAPRLVPPGYLGLK